MPKITINEVDETVAVGAGAATDVVYVPGLANTNNNYLIFRTSGEGPVEDIPTSEIAGHLSTAEANSDNINWELNDPLLGTGEYPQYACNVVDKITWSCISELYDQDDKVFKYTWKKCSLYIEPHPENAPTLCSSVAEFESYFGKTPVQFKTAQSVSEIFNNPLYPAFAPGSLDFYRAGDYERSYIYAKELINMGIPVIYENITSRNKPSVRYYVSFAWANGASLVGCTPKTFLTKIGEYEEDKHQIPVKNLDVGTYSYTIVYDTDMWKYQPAMGAPITGNNESFGITLSTGRSLNNDKITIVIEASLNSDGQIVYAFISNRSKYEAYSAVSNIDRETYAQKTFNKQQTFTCTITGSGSDKVVTWKCNDTAVSLSDYGITLDNSELSTNDSFTVNVSFIDDSKTKDTSSLKLIYDTLAGKDSPYSSAEKLIDKGEYTVKFITAGVYPVYEAVGVYKSITNKMIECAYNRGDSVAIIDHGNNPQRSLDPNESTSIYHHLSQTVDHDLNGSDAYNVFATMFTPWATYSCTTAPKGATTCLMPASFGYLTALAISIKTNVNWIAIAGVNRGLPPTIKALNIINRLSNVIADDYQPRDKRALNAITEIKPYGLTIWGNRTLASNADGDLKATSFLNVRNLVSDIKKVAYTTAKSLLYEQDNETMWTKFKFSMSDTLDRMVAGYGLASYKIIRATTTYTGKPLGKGEVAAVIRVVPVYAVESFEITIVMADDVEVS